MWRKLLAGKTGELKDFQRGVVCARYQDRQEGRGTVGDKAASAGPMEGRESQVRRISWCPVKPFRHGCKYKDGLK